MILSFKEKRVLQQENEKGYAELALNPSFKEKREIQRRIEANLAKLLDTAVTQVKTLYDRLIAGEFYGLDVLAFIKKIKEVIAEIGYDAWKTLKEPCIEYLKRNEKELFTA